MTCAHQKRILGGATLVCNLEAGHEGPHGIRVTPQMAPYVRWSA